MLPLAAAFGWEGRGGEPELAPGPPERGAGGSQSVAAPSNWSKRTWLLLRAEPAAWPRQRASIPGEGPVSLIRSIAPIALPQPPTPRPPWGRGATAEPHRSPSPCPALPPPVASPAAPSPPGVGSQSPLARAWPPPRAMAPASVAQLELAPAQRRQTRRQEAAVPGPDPLISPFCCVWGGSNGGGKNSAPSLASSVDGCPHSLLPSPCHSPQPASPPKPELGGAGMNWVMQLALQP